MQLRVAAILLGILAMTAAPTFAQMTGGAKVGINWATVSEEDEEDNDIGSKTGLVIGGFVNVPITPMFSFAPEVLYTQKGAKQEFTEGGFDFEQKLKLDFIQIPLLFKASGFADSATVRPFFTVGPAIGFLTKGRFEESVDGDEFDTDIKDELKSTDFSLVVGGGAHFGRGIFEIRYDHGFTNLEDEDEGGNGELKTRTFSVLFGFGF